MTDEQGRKAIFISGGGSGIGRATALLFAERGWLVGIGDIDDVGAAETAAMIGSDRASPHPLDVRDRDKWAGALAAFVYRAGRLDVLFNNAGIAAGGPFETAPPDEIDRVVAINFMGVLNGAQAGFAHLKATPGSCLLNTSSAAGIYGAANLAAYSATKFGVRGLTEALDIEWRDHGIKVRSLMPSFIDTPLLDATVGGSNRTARESVVEAGLEFTPVERVAQAAWDAVHGSAVHTIVGKTAKKIAFAARWAPWLVTRRS